MQTSGSNENNGFGAGCRGGENNGQESMAGNTCECGHSRMGDHRGGLRECMVAGCKCDQFHEVVVDNAVDKVCIVCSRGYQCSMSKPGEGICNICMKVIERNYVSDSMFYLFGWRDDKVSQLLAKKLATEILKSGATVPDLWVYWTINHEKLADTKTDD